METQFGKFDTIAKFSVVGENKSRKKGAVCKHTWESTERLDSCALF